VKEIQFVREEFQLWAKHAQELGFTDFISPEDGFSTELSNNSKWENESSAGVYAWITENGHSYVGQAVNVRSRLGQHWKNYRDIAYASFQIVEAASLDHAEKVLIVKMEERFPSTTLNIKFAASSAKTVPFDLIFPPKKTEKFLAGQGMTASQKWQDWPLLENKRERRFAKFKMEPLYGKALAALQVFIERCIPDAPGTEVKFWSVSLLHPLKQTFRVNVGQQEVFTLWDDGTHIFARILAKSQLSPDFDFPLYETNSFANFVKLEEFDSWLVAEKIIECRKLVVWLMRHTVPLNSGSHCPQLIRAVLQP